MKFSRTLGSDFNALKSERVENGMVRTAHRDDPFIRATLAI